MIGTPLTITISSRPLRLLFIVHERDDIVQAVQLFTHVWGGRSNLILPSPTNEAEADLFERALRRFDPDAILTLKTRLSSFEKEILGRYPTEVLTVTDEQILRHALGEEFLRLRDGELAHSGLVIEAIYPNGLARSNIQVTESAATDFFLTLMYGMPTPLFQKYLIRQLHANVLKMPDTFIDKCKLAILWGNVGTPISLSMIDVRQNWSVIMPSPDRDLSGMLEGPQIRDSSSLYIFLDGEVGIASPCAFWNIGGQSSIQNKLFLPYQEFMENVAVVLPLLHEVFDFNQLVIVVETTKPEATDIVSILQQSLEEVGIDAQVAICFESFKYVLLSARTSYDIAQTYTAFLGDDNSLRYVPQPPIGHNQQRMLFGYYCKIRTTHNRTISLPVVPEIAILLMNEYERIQRAESNADNLGNIWLRRSPIVRPYKEGVTGYARAGTECLFFWHGADTWITELVANSGLHIRPNRHTQYARGFIRKFGGIGKTVGLIREGGEKIIRALTSHRAEQCGFVVARINSFLRNEFDMDNAIARQLVEKRLPELLETGLVRRGVALTCPECTLKDWYPVNQIDEFVECTGCAVQFQLNERHLEYHYVANTLAKRFIDNGGEALLMTASVLLRIDPSASIMFGGDLYRDSDSQNFAELDLIFLSREALVVVECKSYDTIHDEALIEIQESTRNAITIAQLLGEEDVVIGVVANNNCQSIHSLIRELDTEAQSSGIALSLILNGEFFLPGNHEPKEPSKIFFTKTKNFVTPKIIGDVKTQFGIGGGARVFNPEILETWKQELLSDGFIT